MPGRAGKRLNNRSGCWVLSFQLAVNAPVYLVALAGKPPLPIPCIDLGECLMYLNLYA